jgi:hypothetical protein
MPDFAVLDSDMANDFAGPDSNPMTSSLLKWLAADPSRHYSQPVIKAAQKFLVSMMEADLQRWQAWCLLRGNPVPAAGSPAAHFRVT